MAVLCVDVDVFVCLWLVRGYVTYQYGYVIRIIVDVSHINVDVFTYSIMDVFWCFVDVNNVKLIRTVEMFRVRRCLISKN